jgi:hypothetical protein
MTPFIFFALMIVVAIITANTASALSFPAFLQQTIIGLVLPFGVASLGGGMIAADVKDHWARTTLLRPVTREQYLLARVGAVFSGYIACVFIAGILPVPLASIMLGVPITGTFSHVVGIVVFSSLQALLILVLMTMLSCWLPGITNLIVLAVWAVGSQMIGAFIGRKYWDDALLSTVKEFTFPSGFLEAVEAVQGGTTDMWAGVLWGCSALAGFSAITIWAFNRMNVEAGSE